MSPDTNFADTLQCSPLASNLERWVTSANLGQTGLDFAPDGFLSVTAHLLQNPNLNSSNLFRADILYDSAGILKTPEDKERELVSGSQIGDVEKPNISNLGVMPARSYLGLELNRTVIRRFIPRNRNVDRQLEQTCHFYNGAKDIGSHDFFDVEHGGSDRPLKRLSNLVVYIPHISSQQDLPWYHPSVRALAFLYEFDFPSGNAAEGQKGTGRLSVHFLPFSSDTGYMISERLQRILLSLLSTQLRLVRGSYASYASGDITPKTPKDNIIPQHILQNMYSRLKEAHAPGLIREWVEDTEPSKHVFEDIMIAAFLIELWRLMYGTSCQTPEDNRTPFPGFVDIACGNGVLVYILHAEGYQGWGFDARRRKTWSKFPLSTQDRLKETICIPRPFEEILETTRPETVKQGNPQIHSGIFAKGTFIISNHADELTLWTPLLGFFSDPDCPLPFLAIPCCSHALSGARCRYPPPKATSSSSARKTNTPPIRTFTHEDNKKTNIPSKSEAAIPPNKGEDKGELRESELGEDQDPTPQPLTGDLKALRLSKLQAQSNPQSSAYGSLTAKVMRVAEEIGYDVDKTKLRIPSTRNIGIVGGWRRRQGMCMATDMNAGAQPEDAFETKAREDEAADAVDKVWAVVERETRRDGGLDVAAKIWIERAFGLQRGQGRGKLKGVPRP
jgi:tRNASer (uridine44-2'-O)-methyltransferase